MLVASRIQIFFLNSEPSWLIILLPSLCLSCSFFDGRKCPKIKSTAVHLKSDGVLRSVSWRWSVHTSDSFWLGWVLPSERDYPKNSNWLGLCPRLICQARMDHARLPRRVTPSSQGQDFLETASRQQDSLSESTLSLNLCLINSVRQSQTRATG